MTIIDYAEMTEMAWSICKAAHDGQVDKAGEPYWKHPWRVAHDVSRVAPSEHSSMAIYVSVAYLHDVIEDTDETLESLGETFPSEVIEALDAITRRNDESYKSYIDRVCANDVARRVKWRDLMDNLNPARARSISVEQRERYLDALSTILIHENRNMSGSQS